MKVMENKRDLLHYRQGKENEGTCTGCEHYSKLKCNVLNGTVHYDMRCDAWNDCETENTWHLLVMGFSNMVCVVVKENNLVVARGQFDLPVKSVDDEVIQIIGGAALERGCPDFVTNISPSAFKSLKFESWLEFMGIEYRELETGIEKMEMQWDGKRSFLDVIPVMIDSALRETNGE